METEGYSTLRVRVMTDMSSTVWSSVMIRTTLGLALAASAVSSGDDAVTARAAAPVATIAPRAHTVRAIGGRDTRLGRKLRFGAETRPGFDERTPIR